MPSAGRLDDNGHVVAGGTGRRSAWPRRVAAYLRVIEDRPAPAKVALVADAALAAVATTAALAAVILQARNTGGSPSPWLVPGTALTTLPLALRRVHPITAFLVIMAAVVSTSGDTTAVTFAMVVVAAYSAVAYSRFPRLSPVCVLAVAVVVTAAYPDTSPPVPARYGALLVLLTTAAVGIAIRTSRHRAIQSAERLRVAQHEHEAQTRRAIELERTRIAAEMHDVVTHHVSVMVVQAGAARRVLDSSPDQARQALLAVEAMGRTAMTELRHLLGLLAPAGAGEPGAHPEGWPDEAAFSPQPGLAQVRALVDRVRAAGLPVELSITGTCVLPPGPNLAAYRIVQEALTNVLKHAGQAKTAVRVECRPRELLITVSDDGRAPGAAASGAADGGPGGPAGRGLIGLRERIAVYQGELDAGPRPGGGWRLVARLPLEPVTAPDGQQDPDLAATQDVRGAPA
jgi:signal transduction histidine kinase